MESQSFSQQPRSLSSDQTKAELSAFMTQVYGWMTIAMLVTAVVSLFTAGSPAMLELIFGNKIVFYGLLIAEVALVWYVSASIQKLAPGTATALFILYSALNGLVLAFIFLVYTGGSIASTFFVTAGTFGAMSLYGYTTKRDLTSWGGFLMMAVIGLIIASVVNIFWQNELLYWIATYARVLIFVGLTAYDTQKIKEMALAGHTSRNMAVMGALRLYLDFVNLFLFMLRLLGGRRS